MAITSSPYSYFSSQSMLPLPLPMTVITAPFNYGLKQISSEVLAKGGTMNKPCTEFTLRSSEEDALKTSSWPSIKTGGIDCLIFATSIKKRAKHFQFERSSKEQIEAGISALLKELIKEKSFNQFTNAALAQKIQAEIQLYVSRLQAELSWSVALIILQPETQVHQAFVDSAFSPFVRMVSAASTPNINAMAVLTAFPTS